MRKPKPTERDNKAADLIVRGVPVADALRRAGFPPSTARMSTAWVQRSKSLSYALMKRLESIDSIPMPNPEKRADLVRMTLLRNMIMDTGAKGSNMAAKLLGMDKQVDMFVVQQQQSGVFVIQAPEQRHLDTMKTLAKTIESRDIPPDPMPSKDDFPEYE